MTVSSYFKGGSLVDKPAVEATSPVVRENNASASNSISIPGYEKLVIKAGQVDQVVDFYNPEENECYFRISFTLADGMELFSSGMIKPGQRIEKIEINHSLKAGKYEDAILRYDCYALETLQPLNGSETLLNLEVIP